MKIYDVRGIGASLTGSFSGSFKGLFTGPLDGVAATSSYVEYTNVANKPALVSGSSQITYSGISSKPEGIVSGSSQITYSGISSKPEGIVSGSSQVLGFNVFATTGSNQFNGNQSITGSLTVSGQVVAQTLNVQQVTSSIVFSSGSNRFGNNSGNTHRFTGSVNITGSITVNGSGLVPYTGATQEVNLGVYSISANSLLANQITVNPSGTTAAQVFLKHGSSFSLPNGFGSIGSSTGNEFRLYQVSSGGVWRGASISLNSITSSATRTYTLPDSDGTIALASSLSSYLPLTGGTLTGALSGTSASFSDTITSTKNVDTILSATNGGTNRLFTLLSNTSGYFLTGVEGSTAGSLVTNSTAYSGVITTNSTSDLVLGTNFTRRLLIDKSTGAATFSSSVTATSGNFTVDGVATNSVLDILTLSHTTSGTAASGLGAGILFKSERPSGGVNLSRAAIYGIAGSNPDDDGDLTFYTRTDTSGAGFTEKMRINSSGNVGIGTTNPDGQLSGTIGLSIVNATNAALGLSNGTNHWLNYLSGTTYRIWNNSVSEVMTLTYGGNVLIGTTTDNGYKLRVNGGTQASSFNTDSGTTLIATYSTFTTFYTVSNYQTAIYLVTLQLNGYSNYTAYATICQNDSGLVIMNQVNNVAYIQVSGLNIQGSQNSGASQNMVWKIIKIS